MTDPGTIAFLLSVAAVAVKALRTAYEHYKEQEAAEQRKAERRKQSKARKRGDSERTQLAQQSRRDSRRARREAERRARRLVLASLARNLRAARKQLREAKRILIRVQETHETLPDWDERLRIKPTQSRQLRELRGDFHEMEAASGNVRYTIAQCERFQEECVRLRKLVSARSDHFKDADRVNKRLLRLVDYARVPADLPREYSLVWAKCSARRASPRFVLPCGIRATLDPGESLAGSRFTGDHPRRRRVYVRRIDYQKRTAVVSVCMASMLTRFQASKTSTYQARILEDGPDGFAVLVEGMIRAHLPRDQAMLGDHRTDGTIAVQFRELDRFFDAPIVSQVPVSLLKRRPRRASTAAGG